MSQKKSINESNSLKFKATFSDDTDDQGNINAKIAVIKILK